MFVSFRDCPREGPSEAGEEPEFTGHPRAMALGVPDLKVPRVFGLSKGHALPFHPRRWCNIVKGACVCSERASLIPGRTFSVLAVWEPAGRPGMGD